MNQQVEQLEKALAAVRARLLSEDVTTEGFGEVRVLYNELSDSLIRVAHKSDSEIATRLNTTVVAISEEWETNKAVLGNWTDVLRNIVQGVGDILSIAGLSNPLGSLLSNSK